MTQHESIIIALCRCALSGNPTDATKHQIKRLQLLYRVNGSEMADIIDGLLNPVPNEMDNLKIIQSKTPPHE